MRFLTRWLINGAGFLTAILVVAGIIPTKSGTWDIFAIAAVAGLVNTLLGPILRFFTFPFVILTLGLWLIVLNIVLFYIAGFVGRELGFGFVVLDFWSAIFGALIVSTVNLIFGLFFSSAKR